MTSDLVIADLTGHNANVIYEVAIRHCFNKPIISLIDQKEKVPFDFFDERVIHFDIKDMESIDSAKKMIAQFIENIGDPSFMYASPVKRALGIDVNLETSLLNRIEYISNEVDDISVNVGIIEYDVSDVKSTIEDIEREVTDKNDDSPRRFILVKEIENLKYEIQQLADIVKKR